MSLVRVLRTTQVVVTHTFHSDGVATDASGTVTCTLSRLDGTVVTSGAASHPGPAGVYQFTVPAQSNLDTLTLDWAGTVAGAAVSVRDLVEVVGGFFFGLAEFVAEHGVDTNRHPMAKLAAKRIEVEQEAERIAGHAMVPRFTRVALSGTGRTTLVLPHQVVRTLRAVSAGGSVWSGPDVTAVAALDSGVLVRPGGATWPAGAGNVVVEYEHGDDMPPEPVRSAAMERMRYLLSRPSSAVPDRAVSFSVAQGGVYRLSTPSRERTGMPDVDAAYLGAQVEVGGFA